MEDNITSNVLKFADDTKVFRKVNTDGDKQHLQKDLDKLVKRFEKLQMLFNFGKCKCLHTGNGNFDINYNMGDTVLGTTVKAWRPYREKDIDTLGRIQRRATKMIPELRDLSYEKRLKECGLTTLETRRGDQIKVFKILNGYENIDRNVFFSLKKDCRTRGH